MRGGFWCWALLGLALLEVPSVTALAGTHPSIFFAAGELPALRAKVTDGLGPDDAAFATVISQADSYVWMDDQALISAGIVNSQGQQALNALIVAYYLSATPNQAWLDRCKSFAQYLITTHGPNPADALGSGARLHNLALAFDHCYGSATQTEIDAVVAEMEQYIGDLTTVGAYTAFQYPPYNSNKGAALASGLGLAWIVLQGSSSNTALLNSAKTWSDRYLGQVHTQLLDADGSYAEGLLYGGFSFQFLVPYYEARERYDGTRFADLPQVRNAQNWFAYELFPWGGGYTNNLNDAQYNERPLPIFNTYWEWAMGEYQSGLSRWLFDHIVTPYGSQGVIDDAAVALWADDIAPVNPGTVLPDSTLFRGRGLYYYRTGWPEGASSSDIVFSFYSGQFKGGHAQEDQNQFTLAGFGSRFIVDAGINAGAAQAKQTEAHNLILIDGRGQHNSGSSCGTDGSMTTALQSQTQDLLHGDAKAAYTTYSPYNAPNWPVPGNDWSWCYQGSANPVLNADRYVFLKKPEGSLPFYVVLFDDLNKDGTPHTYQLLMHTLDANTVALGSNPISVTAATGFLDLYVAHPAWADLAVAQDAYPTGNADSPTKRILLTRTAVNPYYVYVLLPKGGGTPTPAYASTQQADGALATLTWAGATDRIIASFDGDTTILGLQVVGKLGFVRTGGAPSRYALLEGTRLADGSRALVEASAPASVSLSGTALTVSDAALAYTLYGPAVTSVTSGGVAVPFARAGEYVYINTAPPAVTGDCDLDGDGYVAATAACGGSDCQDSEMSASRTDGSLCYPSTLVSYDSTLHNEVADHTWVRIGDTWHLLFQNGPRIIHTSTPDYAFWTPEEFVYEVNPASNWETVGTWAPHIVKVGATYYMFYTGTDAAGNNPANKQRIGLATSTDLVTWARAAVNNCPGTTTDGCVYECVSPWTAWGTNGGTPAGWYNNQCRDPMLYYDEAAGQWVMYTTVRLAWDLSARYPQYQSWMDGKQSVLISTSANLLDWTPQGFVDTAVEAETENPFLEKFNNTYYLFYTNWRYDEVGTNQAMLHYVTAPTPTGPWSAWRPIPIMGLNAPEISHPQPDAYVFTARVATGTGGMSEYMLNLVFHRLVWQENGGLEMDRVVRPSCLLASAAVNPGQPEDCANYFDDDCDGAIDTADTGCVVPVVDTDLNDDGRTDLLDLQALASDFRKPAAQRLYASDVNGDGSVNILDLVRVAKDVIFQ